MNRIGIIALIALVLISAPVSALTYDQMARYPDKYAGSPVTITGEVSQVFYDDTGMAIRMYTGKSSYGNYIEDDLMVLFSPAPTGMRVLEDDIVTVTGTFAGEYKYETLLGATRTVPGIIGKTVVIQ